MSRRQLIRSLAYGCLGLVTADVIAGKPLGGREPGGPVRSGQILTESQMKLLRALVETIIPQTDTPGASATDTHGFIDDQLANCKAPDEANQFIEALDEFARVAKAQWGDDFANLNPADQQAAVAALAGSGVPFEKLPAAFFRQLKALTVIGYYSSEAGASHELVYLPIPGGYRASFTVADNGGKSFSPHTF